MDRLLSMRYRTARSKLRKELTKLLNSSQRKALKIQKLKYATENSKRKKRLLRFVFIIGFFLVTAAGIVLIAYYLEIVAIPWILFHH